MTDDESEMIRDDQIRSSYCGTKNRPVRRGEFQPSLLATLSRLCGE